ncbi:MAG TPA: SirB2 family protein [Chiayiivirga sp.]|nr:SirB2 family protein [Chiayiivirga sp.]
MIEFYPQIKAAHIGFVLASGLLFALRGALVLLGLRWPLSAPVRYLSYTIDTCLLTAALMLLAVLHLNPFTTAWLAVKLAMLLAYVVLGTMALRRARGRRAKFAFYLAALAAFGFMYSVARAHHPLGMFFTWFG